VTFRTVLETYGGNQLLEDLIRGNVRFDGTLTFSVAIRDISMLRSLLCPVSILPGLGHLTGMISRSESVVVEGQGQFRVLRCGLNDCDNRTPCYDKQNREPYQGYEEQILMFAFSVPDQELSLGKIIKEEKLSLNVEILPDDLPSGSMDLPKNPVCYEIGVEPDRVSRLPGQRIRIRYGDAHKAYSGPCPRRSEDRGSEDKDIGELHFERKDRDDAAWINLGLLDCVAFDRYLPGLSR
jgi:hypothetical protein